MDLSGDPQFEKRCDTVFDNLRRFYRTMFVGARAILCLNITFFVRSSLGIYFSFLKKKNNSYNGRTKIKL